MIENPRLLPLLLLAFLPLILHLLDRRRARVADWPAVRFLLLGSRARLRRLQLREAILIMARSLAVLAVVLAALGPASETQEAPGRRAAGLRGVVIVADTSHSMTYRSGPEGRTSLERAMAAAGSILEGLEPPDEAVLITSGVEEGGGTFEEAARARGIEAARAAARALSPEAGGFDLVRLLDRAATEAGRLSTPAREVYVLTDLQASMLPDSELPRLEFLAARLRGAGGSTARVRLVLVDCGAERPVNRYLADLAAAPVAAAAEGLAAIEAVAGTAGAAPPVEATVRLLAGDEEIGREAVHLEAGKTGTVRFQGRIDPGGSSPAGAAGEGAAAVALTARLEGEGLEADGLEEDDARRAVVEVLRSIPVLVVRGVPEAGAAAAARYLELALYPEVEGQPPPPVPFRPTPAGTVPADLASYRVVILCDPARVEAEEAARLERHVRGGGGLLILAGGRADLALWNEHLFQGGAGVLPARLEGRAAAGAGQSFAPRDVDAAHPALSIFSSPEEGDLTRLRIFAYTRAGGWPEEARPLAWVEPGAPWLLERRLGRGKVILVTTGATPDDSDLPRSPLFLPLLHSLVRNLAAEDPRLRNVLVGEPLAWTVREPAPVFEAYALDPRGERRAVERFEEERAVGLRCRDTRVPGFYTLLYEEPDGARRLSRLFAANLPPEESRLERLSEATLGELRSHLGLEVSRPEEDLEPAAVAALARRNYRPLALAAALVFLLVEQILARACATTSRE